MRQTTRKEVLTKLRRRYSSAGPEHKRKLLDEAQELLGYHRKAAIRALRAATIERGPHIITGRPVTYEPELLLRYLRPISLPNLPIAATHGTYISRQASPGGDVQR